LGDTADTLRRWTKVSSVLDMREERTEIDGIPARVYDPGKATALLLLGHGGGHGKNSERFVHLSRCYAEATGLVVVCIDAVDHGERKPPGADANVPRGWHSNSVDRMIQDWRTIVDTFSTIGPPIAYVGFSMGVIFGVPTVAAMPSIRAAVFAVGGIPAGGGIDDPQLASVLLDAASKLDKTQVLMLNKTRDEVFPTDGTHALFDRIPGSKKRLMFWEGGHDDWPPEMISQSVNFISDHTR
jgi:dienelactone hydrolase